MFISVKEAAELTGKSATTIYRLCNKRINTEYVLKEDNKFLIDREYLLATYPPEDSDDANEELPEMRFANVVDEPKVEKTEEKSVILEESKFSSNKTSIYSEKDKIDAGETIEFDDTLDQKSSYWKSIFTNEAIVGVGTSLLIIALIIYILFKFTN